MPKAVTSMVYYLSHWCASIHPPKESNGNTNMLQLDARLQVQVYLPRYTFQAPGQLAYMSEFGRLPFAISARPAASQLFWIDQQEISRDFESAANSFSRYIICSRISALNLLCNYLDKQATFVQCS
jgi:hypothetical protein